MVKCLEVMVGIFSETPVKQHRVYRIRKIKNSFDLHNCIDRYMVTTLLSRLEFLVEILETILTCKGKKETPQRN